MVNRQTFWESYITLWWWALFRMNYFLVENCVRSSIDLVSLLTDSLCKWRKILRVWKLIFKILDGNLISSMILRRLVKLFWGENCSDKNIRIEICCHCCLLALFFLKTAFCMESPNTRPFRIFCMWLLVCACTLCMIHQSRISVHAFMGLIAL